jgi:transcriptional regulator with XRE-family HTH domain
MGTRSIPQSKVAEQSGMTQAMLSRYIHGTSMPGIDKIYALASTLGCRVVDILGDLCEE